MDFVGIVNLDWLERALGLADGSGVNFFALIALMLGVFFSQSAERPRRFISYAFLIGAFFLVGLSIFDQKRHQVYRFAFVETTGSSNKGEHYDILPEAGLHVNVWSKVRDQFSNVQMIWVKEGRFYSGDNVWITFSDRHPTLGSRSRVRIPWCDSFNTQFNLKVEDFQSSDTGELSRSYKLETVGASCAEPETARDLTGMQNVVLAAIIPAFAQSGQPISGTETNLAQLGGLTQDLSNRFPHAASEIDLRYYEKRVDGRSVIDVANSFENDVFQVEAFPGLELDMTVRVTAIQSRSQELPTNALWYGREVPREVALAVARALAEAGIELRYVGPYVFDDTRLNTIEVGYSRRESTNPILSVGDIEAIFNGIE